MKKESFFKISYLLFKVLILIQNVASPLAEISIILEAKLKQNLPQEISKISCLNIILSIFGNYEILIKGSLPGEKEILHVLYNVVSTFGS